MQDFISASDLIALYNVNQGTVDAFTYTRKDTHFVKQIKGKNFFNIKAMKEIRTTRKRVWNASHDYYYWLTLEAGIKNMDLVRRVLEDTGFGNSKTWQVFFSVALWYSLEDISILAVDSKSDYLFTFCRWAELNIKSIKKSMDSKIDIEVKQTERDIKVSFPKFKSLHNKALNKILKQSEAKVKAEARKNKRLYQEILDEEMEEMGIAC